MHTKTFFIVRNMTNFQNPDSCLFVSYVVYRKSAASFFHVDCVHTWWSLHVLLLTLRQKMHSVIFLFKILNNRLHCENLLKLVDLHIPRVNVRHKHIFHLSNHQTILYQVASIHQMCANYMEIESRLDVSCSTFSCIKNLYSVYI